MGNMDTSEALLMELLLVFHKERPFLVLDLNLISNLHVTWQITLVNWQITLVKLWFTVKQQFTSCKLPVYNCKLLKGASTSIAVSWSDAFYDIRKKINMLMIHDDTR